MCKNNHDLASTLYLKTSIVFKSLHSAIMYVSNISFLRIWRQSQNKKKRWKSSKKKEKRLKTPKKQPPKKRSPNIRRRRKT